MCLPSRAFLHDIGLLLDHLQIPMNSLALECLFLIAAVENGFEQYSCMTAHLLTSGCVCIHSSCCHSFMACFRFWLVAPIYTSCRLNCSIASPLSDGRLRSASSPGWLTKTLRSALRQNVESTATRERQTGADGRRALQSGSRAKSGTMVARCCDNW